MARDVENLIWIPTSPLWCQGEKTEEMLATIFDSPYVMMLKDGTSSKTRYIWRIGTSYVINS